MKTENYYLGLDVGTDSVGYAVTNPDYRLIKFKGEPMWGVTVFEAANQSAERRGYRTARRRLDRKQQRIQLVGELFAGEISRLDPKFFIKRSESDLWREDASCGGFALDGTGYERDYKTIHHLIVELMKDNSPHDVRLVYWACAWLVAHRGHFLSDVGADNIEGLFKFDEIYKQFTEYFEVIPWQCEAEAFSEILRKKMGVTKKEREFYALLFDGKKPKEDDEFGYSRASLIKLLCGGKAKASDLFMRDEYSEIKSFSLDMDEEVLASEVLAPLDDDAELIIRLKSLFDWALLVDARKGRETISEGKVDTYEQHKTDLKMLKNFIRKNLPAKYGEVFRIYDEKIPNYTAYTKNVKSVKNINAYKINKVGKEAFSDYLKKVIKDAQCDEEGEGIKAEILSRLEAKTFLPKQVDSDNRIIPYQLYLYELKRILKNASDYLPFLSEKDGDGMTPAEKIVSVFTFRIPYFVGPLTGPNDKSSHAWIVRKAEGKIFPWNIGNIVDFDKSEDEFIDRMVNKCTYLPGERVLPKNSLLYAKFTVLNEINNIRINRAPISVACKQRLFNELFLKTRRVSHKKIEEALIAWGEMHKGDTLDGIDSTVKSSLGAYHDFARLMASGVLTEDDVENIIARRTYTEDRLRFRRWIDNNYGGLSDADKRYVSSLKYSDFGRLSGYFLNGMEGCRTEEKTGEVHTVIHYLWETNDNLMQILSDRYTFAETVEGYVNDYYCGNKRSLSERLDGMYISNAVKRPIIRMLEITKETVKVCGHAPEKVFIEMARGGTEEEKGKRTESRLEKIRRLYAAAKEDTRELSKQLDAMGSDCEQRLRSESLFLYFMQLGKCMYSAKPIDIAKLKDGTYNVDHIYPQCFVKDDSIDNKVLVLSVDNKIKDDNYPIPETLRNNTGVREHWKALHNAGLITDEKYYRLTRTKGFTDEEKMGFINRQLVETRQATKVAAELLKEMYPDTEIVYVKARLASEFRQAFDMLKTREVNDLHHAKDAYLNIVVGNVYDERFRKGRFTVTEKYNAQPKKLFEKPVRIGSRQVWNGEESIAAVRKTMQKNAVRFTRYAFCRKGGLFDQMPLRAAEGLVERKKGLDSGKYGGYNKTTATFFILASFIKKKKKEAMLVPVELMYRDKFLSDAEFAKEYIRGEAEKIGGGPLSDVSFPLGMRPIKINTVIELDGCRLCITGKSSGGKKLGLTLHDPLIIDYRFERYVKNLEKFAERKKKNKNAAIDEVFDGISAMQNLELYDEYFKKLSNKPYSRILESQISVLEKGREVFTGLSLEEQAGVLLQIVALLKTGRAGGCDLTAVKGVAEAGVTTLSSSLSNWKKKYSSAVIVDMSPAGLFEKRSFNLLDLV